MVAGDDDWYEVPTILSDIDARYDGSRGKLVKATIGVTQHGMTVRRTTQMRVR